MFVNTKNCCNVYKAKIFYCCDINNLVLYPTPNIYVNFGTIYLKVEWLNDLKLDVMHELEAEQWHFFKDKTDPQNRWYSPRWPVNSINSLHCMSIFMRLILIIWLNDTYFNTLVFLQPAILPHIIYFCFHFVAHIILV